MTKTEERLSRKIRPSPQSKLDFRSRRPPSSLCSLPFLPHKQFPILLCFSTCSRSAAATARPQPRRRDSPRLVSPCRIVCALFLLTPRLPPNPILLPKRVAPLPSALASVWSYLFNFLLPSPRIPRVCLARVLFVAARPFPSPSRALSRLLRRIFILSPRFSTEFAPRPPHPPWAIRHSPNLFPFLLFLNLTLLLLFFPRG